MSLKNCYIFYPYQSKQTVSCMDFIKYKMKSDVCSTSKPVCLTWTKLQKVHLFIQETIFKRKTSTFKKIWKCQSICVIHWQYFNYWGYLMPVLKMIIMVS